MTRHSLIKTVWVLFVALFLSVQGLSQAHATINGGVDHTHDGVACDVTLVASEHVVLLPPLQIAAPLEFCPSLTWQPRDISDTPRNFDGRAPPPRAPPTL